MRNTVFRKTTLAACITAATAAGLYTPVSAVAQTPTVLEEIIVSARRREENLQTVPISINAFSEDTLRQFNAIALEDIAELTPGMQFRQIGGAPEIVMRGLAQTDQIGLQANVGVFIDGIFLNNRSTNSASPGVVFGPNAKPAAPAPTRAGVFGMTRTSRPLPSSSPVICDKVIPATIETNRCRTRSVVFSTICKPFTETRRNRFLRS